MKALLIAGVGLGALLLFSKGASAGGPPDETLGAAAPPEGSTPPFEGTPIKRLLKAPSGAVYTVFSWPPNDGGTYSVAVLAGSTLWISFSRKGSVSTAMKTNCSDQALLKRMKTDWALP